jgi:hypothetical protein
MREILDPIVVGRVIPLIQQQIKAVHDAIGQGHTGILVKVRI